MQDGFFGGLNFGTNGAGLSIINFKKEVKYFNSVPYFYNSKNPNSWINACEKLLYKIPLDIKNNIINLAISGISGTLTSCDLKGDPLGEAIPYYQSCNENKHLFESITVGEDHVQRPNR